MISRTRKTPKCCDKGTQKHPNCLPIEIPTGVSVPSTLYLLSPSRNKNHFRTTSSSSTIGGA